jgi:type IV secretory pathway VirD2 relaxase
MANKANQRRTKPADPSKLGYNKHAADDKGRLRVRKRRSESSITLKLRAAKPSGSTNKQRKVLSHGAGKKGKIFGGRGRSKPDAYSHRNQRCLTKMTYAKKPTAWVAHGKYLERDGTQKDGSPAQPFGSAVDKYGSLNEAMKVFAEEDKVMWKAVISPEFGERVDLEKLVSGYVREMEKELHTKLEWAAVAHYNTGHPHIHLLIRGKDEHGKELRLSPDWLKDRARAIGEEETTKQIGHRTEKDIQLAKERMVDADRWTPIDKQIVAEAENGFVAGYDNSRSAHDQHLISARMAHLEKLGLAKRDGLDWAVRPDMELALRQIGQLQDRTKMLHEHQAMLTEKHAVAQVHIKPPVGTVIAGRVVGGGLNEATDKPYLIVEGHDLRIHMIDQTDALGKMRGVGQLGNGHVVRLEVKSFGKGTYIDAQDFGAYHKGAIPKAALLNGIADASLSCESTLSGGLSVRKHANEAESVMVKHTQAPVSLGKLDAAVGFAKDFRQSAQLEMEKVEGLSVQEIRLQAAIEQLKTRQPKAIEWDGSQSREGTVVDGIRGAVAVQDNKGIWLAKVSVGKDDRIFQPKKGVDVILIGSDVPVLRKMDHIIASEGFSLDEIKNPMFKQQVEKRLTTWEKEGLYVAGKHKPEVAGLDGLKALEDRLDKKRRKGLLIKKDKQVVPVELKTALDKTYGKASEKFVDKGKVRGV